MKSEKKRLRVGVIFGGRSGEHEVSVVSASSVIKALDPAKYEAVPIGITIKSPRFTLEPCWLHNVIWPDNVASWSIRASIW